MKPGIATIALRKYDVFYAIDLAAEAGFLGVEIWGRPPHTPAEFDESHTAQIRDRARGLGMRVAMFGSYANPCSPDYEQKRDDSLRVAKILGTKRIRVWAGNKEPHEADEQLWRFVAEAMHDYALRAEDEGIRLAMEMHSGTLTATPDGAMRVIEMADSPNLKLNYQVSDTSQAEIERGIALVGDHVINVHAQNYRPSPIEDGKMELCLVEEGVVDYNLVLSLLASHGFKGFVEVEFLKGEFVSDDALLDSLRRDAEYLRGLTARYTA